MGIDGESEVIPLEEIKPPELEELPQNINPDIDVPPERTPEERVAMFEELTREAMQLNRTYFYLDGVYIMPDALADNLIPPPWLELENGEFLVTPPP